MSLYLKELLKKIPMTVKEINVDLPFKALERSSKNQELQDVFKQIDLFSYLINNLPLS